MPGNETIRLVDPDGIVRDVPLDAAASALQDPRWGVATRDDEASRVAAQAREADYGGVGGGIKAGLAATARGLSGGLSDVAARAIGGEDAAIELQGLREEHPGLSTGFEVGGALAPMLVSGGAAGLARGIGAGIEGAGARAAALGAERVGAGLASAGAGVAGLGAEGSALSRLGASAIGRAAELAPSSLASAAGRRVGAAVGGGIRGAVAGGTVEGGLFGLGAGMSNLALSDDPLTVEHVASELSSNILFGAATGGAIGGAAKIAEKGLSATRGAIDSYLERLSTPEVAAKQTSIPEYKALKAQLDASGHDYVETTVPAREIADLGYYEPAGAGVDPVRVDKARAIFGLKSDAPLDGEFELGGAKLNLKTETTPMPGGKNKTTVTVMRTLADGEEVTAASAEFLHRDFELYPRDVNVEPVLRRKGLASRMYDAAERATGKSILPSETQTPEGAAFRAGRDAKRAAPAVGQQEPIKLLVTPEGKVVVDDGRHRLAAAIEANAPIKVKWSTGVEPGEGNVFRSGTMPDVASMDRAALREAEEAERQRLIDAQHPDREKFVAALSDHSAATQAEELWRYTSEHESRAIRGLGKESRAADFKILNLLRNEQGLARNPTVARDALERQAQALAKIESAGLAEHAKFTRDFARAPRTIRQEVLDNKVPGYIVGPGALSPTSPAIDKAVEEEMIKRFGTADPNAYPDAPSRIQVVLDYAGLARERNRSLLRWVEELAKEPASKRLADIQAAKAMLDMPKAAKEPSLGQVALHAVAPFAGPVGAVAVAGNRLIGSFRKVAAQAAKKGGKAVSAFLGAAATGASMAQPLATRVLASLRYGNERNRDESLPELYRARTDEIKQLTAYDETGTPRVRPEARQQIAGKLAPLVAVDPRMADKLETAAVRKVEYLSSIIPRRPDLPGIGDSWRPSEMAMRSWARSAAAAEDPYGVLARAASGAVTPEDAATMQAVHPEILADFISKVTAADKTMPFTKALSLSILSGQPVTPSLHPKVLSILQGRFASEPGTAGGTQSPKPSPQFGSLKKSPDQPTPAQSRAAGHLAV